MNVIRFIESANKSLRVTGDKAYATSALMARYLIHMVGDIHQPLHAANLINKTYPAGDLGGNKLKVNFLKETNFNYHTLWDSGVQYFQNSSFKFWRPLD